MPARHIAKRASLTVLRISVLGSIGLIAATLLTPDARTVATVGAITAAVTLLVEAWPSMFPAADHVVTMPEVHADDLATVITAEWREEARARHLRDPRLLPLSWARTDRDVMDHPEAVVGGPIPGPARLRLAGRVGGDLDQAGAELAESFAQIPSGRLVVLGEPGSGKTVLAITLTLGLLKARPPGAPVPVLLSASSWDPISQSLDRWLVHTLASNYYNGRADIPELLLAQDLLIPVLDGLDEIPEDLRRGAIRSINEAVRTRRPIVVTCRSVEYTDLIVGGAPLLRRAPVIEVAPVAAPDAVAYLESIDWPDGTDWRPVYNDLRQDSESTLSQSLSTPLMVSVARIVYERLGGNPAELIQAGRFDSRHAVEDFLIGQMIDAAYATPAGVVPGRRRLPPRWDAERAQRWLTFIAQYLHRYRERDFTWWMLSQRLLSPWVGPTLGIGSGALTMIAVSTGIAAERSHGTPSTNAIMILGASVGAAFSVLVTLIWYATAGRAPGRLTLSRVGSADRLRRGFRNGMLAALIPVTTALLGLAATLTITSGWTLRNTELFLAGCGSAISLCAVIGIALAGHNWLNGPPRGAAQTTPLELLRQDRRSTWTGALAAGILVGVLALPGAAIGLLGGDLLTKLVSTWAGWPEGGNYHDLARGRVYEISKGTFPTTTLLVEGTLVLPGLLVAALVLLTRAWPRFLITRLLLAGAGRVPWRLSAFLADARARNLLRQSGGAYQFRHMRLQEHLANHALNRPVVYRSPRTRVRVRRAALATACVLALLGAVGLKAIPNNGATETIAGPHHSGPFDVTLSPDKTLLAITSRTRGVVAVKKLGTDEPPARIRLTADQRLNGVLFSPDSHELVLYLETLRHRGRPVESTSVWDLDSGRMRVEGAENVDFTSDLRTMLVIRRTPGIGSGKARWRLEVWNPRSSAPARSLQDVVLRATGRSTFVTSQQATGRLTLRQADDGTRLRDLGSLKDYADAQLLEVGDVSYDPSYEASPADGPYSVDGSVLYLHQRTGPLHVWPVDADRPAVVIPGAPDSQFTISTDQKSVIRKMRSSVHGTAATITVHALPQAAALSRTSIDPYGSIAGRRGFYAGGSGRWTVVYLGGSGDEFSSPPAARVIDTRTGKIVVPNTYGNFLFASSDGQRIDTLLVERTDGNVAKLVVWNLLTARQRYPALRLQPSQSSPGIDTVLLNPDSPTMLVEDPKGRISLLDIATGNRHESAELPQRKSLRTTFTPDGGKFLLSYGRTIEVWRVSPFGRIGQLRGLQSVFPDSSDSILLSTDGTNYADETDQPTVTLDRDPYEEQSDAFMFSPDGKYLLTDSRHSQSAQLWDLSAPSRARSLTGHAGELHAIGFTPDSRMAITVGEQDSTIRLWTLP